MAIIILEIRTLVKTLLSFILCVLLAGCATPYKNNGIMGGYDETILAPNIFRVSFKGNGYTSMERAKDFALLRCADVVIEKGFKFFIITDETTYNKHMTIYTPEETNTKYAIETNGYITGEDSFNVKTKASTTTYSIPGSAFDITKPRVSLIVVAFKDQQQAQQGAFDATFLKKSIKNKYGIKE